MISFRYAFNEKEEIIDVNTLDRNKGLGQYKCIGCGHEMIPHLGKVRKKHFVHKPGNECSGETYLHRLAKNEFYKFYQKCLKESEPFWLEYFDQKSCNSYESDLNLTCDFRPEKKLYDLTTRFKSICLEKKHGSLIPDVRIFDPNSDESIYIEIAVSHDCEVEKIESGIRIIEFMVSDEEDLFMFENCMIPISHEQIRRYNFTEKVRSVDVCSGKCNQRKNVFMVFRSGKSIILEKNLTELLEMIDRGLVIDFVVFTKDYQNCVINAFENDVNIKNCFLCRYHAYNDSPFTDYEESIFCKFLKKRCNSNQAADCEYFRPDKAVYQVYKKKTNWPSSFPVDDGQ